ncbi:hypothetical protein BS78_01G410500 [Paspalum vaginatum]|nr:hypothetical protein BS78_01G410500 [Paspalum vaginatum]
MDQMKNNGGRTPFANISNTIGGDQDEPNLPSSMRRNARDRERYAAMSAEKRNEINKKRREARQRKKRQPIMHGSSTDMDTDTQQLYMNQTSEATNIEASGDMATGLDNCSGVDFTNWATNDMTDELMRSHPNYISPNVNAGEHKRQRDSERCATMFGEESSEMNKKHREVSTGDENKG